MKLIQTYCTLFDKPNLEDMHQATSEEVEAVEDFTTGHISLD